MSKRLMGLLSAAVLVFAACTSSATPSPTAAPPTNPPATTPPVVTPAPVVTQTAAPGPTLNADLNNALFNSNYKPGPGKTGGTLIMGEWQGATQLNPFYTTSFGDFEALGPVMRGFLTISSDGKYIADLAAAVPTTANGGLVIDSDNKGMTVTVKLKPNLKWSDGQPLTGADFKYTVGWAQDPSQKGCTACGVGFTTTDASGKTINLIDNVTVSADGLTIGMHFNQLYASWLSFLAGPTFLPEHYMKTIAIADAATQSMPVSAAAANVPWSGPFMITAAGPTEIDYKPNQYWAGGVGGPHAPYLDSLKFQYFTDKAGMIAAFKNGEIDLAFDMTQADAKSVQGADPISIGKAEVMPAWQYEHFDMNSASKNAPFLSDVNVRKAIYESVDKQSIIDAVFPGAGVTPACSNVPPGLWYRTDVTCPTYNVADAKALLDAANLPVGAGGNRTYNGKPIDLLLCTTAGNSTRLTELQKLQGYLQAVGLKSHIQTGDATSVIFAGWNDTASTPDKPCEMYRGNYDIVDYAYVLGGSPYSDNDPVYDSTQWPENAATGHNGANDSRFKSAAMDAALKILQTAVDPGAQLQAMVAVQQAYVAGLPEIPIYYRAETTGVGIHAGNWPGYNPSSIGPTWDVEDWFYQ